MSKEIALFIPDIEHCGPRYSHPIISIGYVIGTLDGSILMKKRISFATQESDFDEKCYNEFLIHHLDKLSVFNEEAVDIVSGLNILINDIRGYEEMYDLNNCLLHNQFDVDIDNWYFE